MIFEDGNKAHFVYKLNGKAVTIEYYEYKKNIDILSKIYKCEESIASTLLLYSENCLISACLLYDMNKDTLEMYKK